MTSVLRRLLALSGIRASRIAVWVALGSLTVLFGVFPGLVFGFLNSAAAFR